MFFLIGLFLSIIITYFVRIFALKYKILDNPDKTRHFHKQKTPLLGGVAIFLSFWILIGYFYYYNILKLTNVDFRQLVFLFIGSTLLMVIGYFDDRYKISAKLRFVFTMVVVLIVLLGGMNFDGITNPLGGTIGLDLWKINFGWFGSFLVLADALMFFWLLGIIYTTKILDGLDGLATGIALIGGVVIGFLALTTKFYQPDVAFLSFVFAGTCAGFLIYNFYPAKIFLGEGGSMFLGLMLGVLAVIAGGKIATTLLVLAVPVLDLLRVIVVRFKSGQSVIKGDREHLHFKLLDFGFGHRQAVLFLYFVSFVFGFTSLFLSSLYKIIALLVLFILMFLFMFLLEKKYVVSKKAK